MRFGILGTTRAWRDDGSEVRLGGPTRRALLTLLLARPGEVVTADRLVDDLYGAQPPNGAAHALQSQVSRLRQALGPEVTIELGPAGYRLAADLDGVDAHRFEGLADEGRQALGNGDPGRAASLLRAALDLWRGPAFADIADVESVQAHVLRLEERRLGALEDRIEADLQRGEHRAVVPELQELAGRHPLRERLHGLLMRALQADGRQAEALAAFEEVRRLLAEELGADPSAELAAIHQALLRGERPSERPSEPPALPAQLTSFVGRTEDLAKVAELLGTARLVTLLGPGGAGKTRLSIEVASHQPDVCFLELAPLRDEPELAQALLGALGLRESGLFATPAGMTPLSRLAEALADRSLLLVLDNCEHVVSAAAALAERLLSACPKLRILATSREPLGITGENLWPVRSLPLPSAVRLFADRAAAVRPGFVLDDANAEAVRQICQSLDGLPLAIELAAARARTHDVPELAARLDDRFRLLSRGSRTAQARHQTLRAVVAWSWDLLSETEQVMARRFTVFSGGSTAEAAARVCEVPDAEDVLDSLVDKSLVEVHRGRYRMLETIHAYCAEQLHAAGEAEDLPRAHAEFFLELAQTADPHLLRSEQLRWLEILVAEHENLHAALRWAVGAGRVELALRLIASTTVYLWMRGMRTSATAQAATLLDMIGTDPDPGFGDDYVLCALTAAADGTGRQAWDRHRKAAESIIVVPDRAHPHPVATFLWLMVNADGRDPQVALSVITNGRTAGDPWEKGVTHLIWGYPAFTAGEFAEAEREFAEAAGIFRSLGDRWGTAMALDALAWLANACDDPGKAIILTDEALALTEQLGALEDISDLLCNRGDFRARVLARAHDPAQDSVRDPVRGTVHDPVRGSVHDPARGSVHDRAPGEPAHAVPVSGDLAEVRADYEKAAEIARHVGSPTYLASALRGLGDIARLEGDLAEARRLYEQALERFDAHWVKSLGHLAGALIGLGKVAEASGDLAGARERYGQAVELAATAGPLPEGAHAVEALAGIALLEGDVTTAATLLGAATALRRMNVWQDPEVARIASAARAALGEQAYEAAYDEGVRLSHEDALRLVGVPEPIIQTSPTVTMADYA
ncbi:BTAD domain-containing putative transcriptional regulator [Streptosporangium sp. NPDC000396]|uniref:BTAD domain-containing putative transcriptional regulator n=1 Tax=Streptosporangium sp. NPDC000396 TaxID=3366185 RepID=UPI0036CBB9D2